MKIDICVLTAGQRPDLLEKCLESIRPYAEKTKSPVYVFGNGCRLENMPEFVTTKSVKDNRGYPGGANSVIGMGSNPVFLFVSDDIEFTDGAIEHALQMLQSDSQIGMVGFKLLFQSGSRNPAGKVQHVGHACDLHGNIIHPLMGWSADNPRTCISGEVFSVTGATFLTRRKLFRAAGGFNEAYGTGYFEDVELALNMRQRGSKIVLDADAIAYHYVGATFEKLGGSDLRANRQKFILNNANLLVWDTWMRY